jgi:hypothetical protein
MPKTKVSAKSRLKEFPGSCLVVRDGKLNCELCNKELDFLKKSTVEKHMSSASHRLKERKFKLL